MSKVVTNKIQMARMVELLEQDLYFARNELIKSASDKKWQEIASELNQLGPPVRDVDKWQRVWTDLKYKTKKKVDSNKNEFSMNYQNLHTNSSLEDRIMKIMNFNYSYNNEIRNSTVITPIAGPSNFSYNNEIRNSTVTTPIAGPSNLLDQKSNESHVINTNENINHQKKPCNKVTPRKAVLKKIVNGRRPQLLKKQLDFYENVSSEMKNIRKNVEKIQDYFKKQYNLQETALQLKKQKFEFFKEYKLKKESDRKIQLELEIRRKDMRNITHSIYN